MECQIRSYFLGKISKNIIRMPFAESAQSIVSVNWSFMENVGYFHIWRQMASDEYLLTKIVMETRFMSCCEAN